MRPVQTNGDALDAILSADPEIQPSALDEPAPKQEKADHTHSPRAEERADADDAAGMPDQTPPGPEGRRGNGPSPRDGVDDDSLDDLFAEVLQDTPATAKPKSQQSAAMSSLDSILQVGTARPTTRSKWFRRLFWVVVLGGLIWLGTRPYTFEVGGEFVIQPSARAEARARTDGEIMSVNVRRGDWVNADDVLAVISNWDEALDVSQNEADGARLRADLETMKAGARPEQIAVAAEVLHTAEKQVEISARELERMEALFASKTIPERELLEARDAHDVAVSRRNEARANLDLAEAKPRESELNAQLAAIARNDEETEFARRMLESTNIRAPVSGQIVSDLAKVPIGAYLATGALFAEIEDNRTVIAEISLPEVTVQEVKIGAPVELRLWSAADTSIYGKVRAIAPRAEPTDLGPIVRVEVEVANPDGWLAANMTGFGKVTAGDLPAWQVFTRAIYRFFTIEVWSWLP